MNKGTVLALLLVVLGGGYGLGRLATRDKDNSNSPAAAAAMPTTQGPSDGIDRVRVPLEGPMKGADRRQGDDRRVLRLPVPVLQPRRPDGRQDREGLRQARSGSSSATTRCRSTTNAPLAAEAAVAAEAQGKFWEMHDKLFANQQALDRAGLEKYAQEIGLDMGKFKAALDSALGQGARRRRPGGRQADRRAGNAELLHRRPQRHGRAAVRGVQEGHRRRDRARRQADRQGDAPGDGLRRVHEGREGRRPRAPPAAAKGPGASTEVYKVAVGDAPTRGGNQPKVTIIEFSDFQCPYCGRVERDARHAAQGLRQGRRGRVPPQPAAVPPERHAGGPGGRGGPRAGEVLGDARQDVRRPAEPRPPQPGQVRPGDRPRTWSKFKEAMDKEKGKERIKRDMADAAKFGARGTPNFFINGRNFRGAQPLEAFKSVIDEEIKKADAEDRRRHAARTGLRRADRRTASTRRPRRRPPPQPRRARRQRPASAPRSRARR